MFSYFLWMRLWFMLKRFAAVFQVWQFYDIDSNSFDQFPKQLVFNPNPIPQITPYANLKTNPCKNLGQ